MSKLVYLVPLFPFIGFLLNGLFRKKLSKALTSIIGSGVILASFVVSLMIFFEVREEGFKPAVVSLFDFIKVGKLSIPFAFQVDQFGHGDKEFRTQNSEFRISMPGISGERSFLSF